MLKFDYNNVREEVVGSENGLNIQAAFENYKNQI